MRIKNSDVGFGHSCDDKSCAQQGMHDEVSFKKKGWVSIRFACYNCGRYYNVYDVWWPPLFILKYLDSVA